MLSHKSEGNFEKNEQSFRIFFILNPHIPSICEAAGLLTRLHHELMEVLRVK